MAGGHSKYRHLSRTSAARSQLLRHQLTSLFTQEAITTTLAKAKETARLAEKVITLGKKNTAASLRRAHSIFYKPHEMIPVLQGIVPRYVNRQGGYTRVLRLGPRQRDSAEEAVLSLVDGKRDVRFFQTAMVVARDRMMGWPHTAITEENIRGCTNDAVGGVPAGERGKGAGQEGEKPSERFERTVRWYVNMEERGAEGPEAEEVELGKGDHERETDFFYPKVGERDRKFMGRVPENGAGLRRKRPGVVGRVIGS